MAKTGHEPGQVCPFCYTKRYNYVRADYRSDENKKKYPLTEEELTIVACLCLHPGDFVVGGFF